MSAVKGYISVTLLKDLLATAALFGVFLLGCAAVSALLEWRP